MQNKIISLTILQGERQVEAQAPWGSVLLDVLRDCGVTVSAPCAGDGRCGQCRVYVRGGASAPDGDEFAFADIGSTDSEGYMLRLACRVRLEGDCQVRVPCAAAVHKLSDNTANNVGEEPFGAAIDLGTTTVGMRAVSLTDGTSLSELCELNAQRICGADVMTRIACCAKKDGLDTLHRLISSQLTDMIRRLCGGREPQTIAVAGNTVMLHILAGISPEYLGQAPYRTKEYFGREFDGRRLGLPWNAWLLPCIGGYTGGDLTAALTALIHAEYRTCPVPKGTALCDLGTNGEMAVFCGDGWLTASAAAGPALEGGGISCGSGAVEGAVTRIQLGSDGSDHSLVSADGSRCIPVDCTVWNGGEPRTMTGAALVSTTALLLRDGGLEPSGLMQTACWSLNEHVSFTQADVRQLQLAKGAVAAALSRLYEEFKNVRNKNNTNDYLQRSVIITGGLGCCMNPEDALDIGLIPSPADVRFLPNLALEGAALCLTSEGRAQVLDIARSAEVLELTGDDRFDQLFVSCMRLGEPDDMY